MFNKDPLKTLALSDYGTATIHTMTKAGLAHALEVWSPAQGWTPAKYCLDSFYAADPSGYYFLVKEDKPIASISAVRYDNGLAFIGFFIVLDVAMRGKGVGSAFLKAAMELCSERGAPVTFALDAVPLKAPFYSKFGFNVVASDKLFKYQKSDTTLLDEPSAGLEKIALSNVDKVCEYDQMVFGAPRADFLKAFILKPETIAYLERNASGEVVGYGVMTPKVSPKADEDAGLRIGPVYAQTSLSAKNLISMLCIEAGSRTVTMDVPETNEKGVALVSRELPFREFFELRRMHQGPLHAEDTNKVWAWGSLTIGG